MNKKKLCLLITIALTFVYEKPLSAQEMKPKDTGNKPELISGIWNCNDGGKYYVRIDGNDCYWFGESDDEGASWVNIFIGKIEGAQIKGIWFDLPKGKNRGKGDLVLDIAPDMKAFNFVDGTGGFSGRQWKKTEASSAIRRRSIPIPKKQEDIVKEVEPKEVEEKYRGHSYKFIPMKESWNKAKVIAKEMGGHLVSITSDEENKFVVSLIQKASSERQDKNPEVRIGLNNDNEKKQWKWESGEKYDYNSWWEGEPNNWANSESSVVINKQSMISPESVGKWNDKSSDFKTYFVVERNSP